MYLTTIDPTTMASLIDIDAGELDYELVNNTLIEDDLDIVEHLDITADDTHGHEDESGDEGPNYGDDETDSLKHWVVEIREEKFDASIELASSLVVQRADADSALAEGGAGAVQVAAPESFRCDQK